MDDQTCVVCNFSIFPLKELFLTTEREKADKFENKENPDNYRPGF